MMFLLPMLMACVAGSRDSGGNSGDSGNGIEDPRWFEAGSIRCVSGFCDYNPTFTFTQTGSVSDYEFNFETTLLDFQDQEGTCLIGDAITPDESAWKATCDGGTISDVTVYSNGFIMDVTWSTSVAGGSLTATFE